MEESICKNCSEKFKGSYCWNCGQKKIIRLTPKDLLAYLFDTLELKRGFFITLITMIKKPNLLVKEYLEGKTVKYQNPTTYLLTFISIFIITDLAFSYFDDEKPDPEFLIYFIVLPLVITTSISIRLLYPKNGLNATELLIFSCYFIASFTLFLSLIEFSNLIFPSEFVNSVDLILLGTWIIVVSNQFFGSFFVNYKYNIVRSIMVPISSVLLLSIGMSLIIGLLFIFGLDGVLESLNLI